MGPGDLVVCVRGRGYGALKRGEVEPIKGHIYTVREVVDMGQWGLGVYLEEIINPPNLCVFGFIERAYAPERFRPVDPQRLSIFRKALTPIREKERA